MLIFYLRQNKFSRVQICNFVGGPKSNVLAEALLPRNILCDAILDALHFSTVWALHCTKNPRYFTEFGLF